MAELFIDFANSELYDGKGNLDDRLYDADWRRAFLADWGLPGHGDLDEGDLRELAELRATIRSTIERTRSGRKPTARAAERIDAALADGPVRYRLSTKGLRPHVEVVPLAEGREAIAGAVALSFARFLADGELDRLKTCDNRGCRWVFYDETRNRSRRWCGPCGNVDKVRRFRERRRAAGRE